MRKTQAISALGAIAVAMLAASSAAASDDSSSSEKAPYSCYNGHFCAWKDSGYSGTKLLDSTITSGIVYPQQRDAITSGVNKTSKSWCGVNARTANPDETLVRWFAGDEYSNLTGVGANDRIDHFDVISNLASRCPTG